MVHRDIIIFLLYRQYAIALIALSIKIGDYKRFGTKLQR